MTRHHGFVRTIAIAVACTSTLVLGLRADDPPNFKPDGVFKGSALTGWRTVGDADWTATPDSGLDASEALSRARARLK